MTRWEATIGAIRAKRLADILREAALIAHRENGLRFDAEDLGDDPLIYGLCTTVNARHVAATMVEAAEDLVGVSVHEKGRVWWLEVEAGTGRAVRLYFYKAPPGASRVDQLDLKDSEIKKELSVSNGRQLALFTSSGAPGSPRLLNLVAVHYGNPVDGLLGVDVGAPCLVGKEVAWDWGESLLSQREQPRVKEAEGGLGDDDEGFAGLHLLEATVEEVAETRTAAEPPGIEPATTGFDALSLRSAEDDVAEDGRGSR